MIAAAISEVKTMQGFAAATLRKKGKMRFVNLIAERWEKPDISQVGCEKKMGKVIFGRCFR
jgi:hypothetical protein